MSALPADIAAAIRDAAIAQWSDTAISGRYSSARDALTDPSTGYFDSLTDAVSAISARGALIGVERRRFSVTVHDVLWLDPTSAFPTVSLVDTEQGANASFLVTRVEVDLDAETTTLELFG